MKLAFPIMSKTLREQRWTKKDELDESLNLLGDKEAKAAALSDNTDLFETLDSFPEDSILAAIGILPRHQLIMWPMCMCIPCM